MRQPGEYCAWYRDAAGFCLLQNRCWSEKACPRSQIEADQAREALVDELVAQREVRQ